MRKIITATIAVCMLASLLCLSACNFSIYSYDNADSYTAGGGEFGFGEVESWDIDWVSDKVVIKVDDAASDIIISEENNKTEAKYQMQHFVDADKTLHIRFVEDGTTLDAISMHKVLTITLSSSMSYTGMDIVTVSADIDASAFSASNINIDTVSGDVILDDIDTSHLTVNTVSGNVSYSGTMSGDANIDSVSGDIALTNASLSSIYVNSVSGKFSFSGEVTNIVASTVSGNCDIRTSKMPYGVQCDSTSGNIVLSIPENTGFVCSFRTTSGQFDSDFAVTTSGNIHKYGIDDMSIDIKTLSGDLTINRNQ